jgi:hypothetical protein
MNTLWREWVRTILDEKIETCADEEKKAEAKPVYLSQSLVTESKINPPYPKKVDFFQNNR